MHYSSLIGISLALISSPAISSSTDTFVAVDYSNATPATMTHLELLTPKDLTELSPSITRYALPLKNTLSVKSMYSHMDKNREKYGIKNKDGTYGDGYTKQDAADLIQNKKIGELNKKDTTVFIRISDYAKYNPDDEVMRFKIPVVRTSTGYFIHTESGGSKTRQYSAANAFGFVGIVTESTYESFGINMLNIPKALTYDQTLGMYSRTLILNLKIPIEDAKNLKRDGIYLAIAGNNASPLMEETIEHFPATINNLQSTFYRSKGISLFVKKIAVVSKKTGEALGETELESQ